MIISNVLGKEREKVRDRECVIKMKRDRKTHRDRQMERETVRERQIKTRN